MYPSIENFAGNTPLVRLKRIPGGTSNVILAKLERNNPAGSVMVTRDWCVAEFGVANDTAGCDLKGLTELGPLELVGKGRSVRCVAKTTDNRPAQS